MTGIFRQKMQFAKRPQVCVRLEIADRCRRLKCYEIPNVVYPNAAHGYVDDAVNGGHIGITLKPLARSNRQRRRDSERALVPLDG